MRVFSLARAEADSLTRARRFRRSLLDEEEMLLAMHIAAQRFVRHRAPSNPEDLDPRENRHDRPHDDEDPSYSDPEVPVNPRDSENDEDYPHDHDEPIKPKDPRKKPERRPSKRPQTKPKPQDSQSEPEDPRDDPHEHQFDSEDEPTDKPKDPKSLPKL